MLVDDLKSEVRDLLLKRLASFPKHRLHAVKIALIHIREECFLVFCEAQRKLQHLVAARIVLELMIEVLAGLTIRTLLCDELVEHSELPRL